jgi:hypothetical protein
LSKLKLSSSVILSAALLTTALVVTLNAMYPNEKLVLKEYVLIGLVSILIAWVGERVFRKRKKRPTQSTIKKKTDRKKRRRKR